MPHLKTLLVLLFVYSSPNICFLNLDTHGMIAMKLKFGLLKQKIFFLYSWDRIVPETYVLKNTDENKQLMKKLADTTKK